MIDLGGLDVSSSEKMPQIVEPSSQVVNNNNNILNMNSSNLLMDGLFNSIPTLTAYDKNGLKIVFNMERPTDSPDTTVVSMVATNSTTSTFTEFLFQVIFHIFFFILIIIIDYCKIKFFVHRLLYRKPCNYK